ncbi:hypothetical protein Tco_1104777 [Tanacetum coccineum]
MGTMWCLYDPTPSDWCKIDVHSTDFSPRIQINILRIFSKLLTLLILMLKIGKERDCVYFNFPFTTKLAIGLNVFLSDPSPLRRISLPVSLLNSFHRGTAKLRNDILMFQQHQVQIFFDYVNLATRRTIYQSAGGKLPDKNIKESWALIEDLALFDNESWNDPRDLAKPIKAISLPHNVPNASDRRFIELED